MAAKLHEGKQERENNTKNIPNLNGEIKEQENRHIIAIQSNYRRPNTYIEKNIHFKHHGW